MVRAIRGYAKIDNSRYLKIAYDSTVRIRIPVPKTKAVNVRKFNRFMTKLLTGVQLFSSMMKSAKEGRQKVDT